MPYAANGQISKEPVTGGIEITDAEYKSALDGMLSGLMVQVADGVMSLVEPPTERTTYWLAPADEHQTEPGEEPPADAVLTPPPDDYHVIDGGQWTKGPDGWLAHVAAERESRFDTSITVTLSDGDYVVPVTDRSAAQAPEAARRARADTTDTTRPFPTDKGIVERGPDDLDAIGDAIERYLTAVWRRAAELEAMAADGTITETDLDTGWPT